MNSLRYFLIGLLLCLLCACAAQQGQSTASQKASGDALKAATGVPACAVLEAEPQPALRFPAASLYHAGAAVPTAEGLSCLEELAGWLSAAENRGWRVTVSAETTAGLDAAGLATVRTSMLQRFLKRRGVRMQGWQWQQQVDATDQLRFEAVKAAP